MNLILIKESDFTAENLVEISDFRFEHIKNVLKAQNGATLKIGLVNGKIGTGNIISVSGNNAIVETAFDRNPPAKNPATLFCALPRPKVFRRVLLNAVCFGVKEIHFFQAFKVEKSYWQSPFLSPDSIDKTVENALMQAIDTVSPQIYFHKSFKIFVEDVFAPKAQEFPCTAFHPTDGIKKTSPPLDATGAKHGFVIGPEGGFTDYEIDMFLKNNAQSASLGERILRVEQAVCAVLSSGYSGN